MRGRGDRDFRLKLRQGLRFGGRSTHVPEAPSYVSQQSDTNANTANSTSKRSTTSLAVLIPWDLPQHNPVSYQQIT